MIEIDYPGTGNNTQLSYDGLGRCVKIVETTSGSVTSTRQFIWCGSERCEVRDGSSNVTAQFFRYGETISGTSYYFTKDHLGSVREMTNGSGTIVWQQSFDPFGVPTTLVSTTAADMGYAGYYLHSRSGLSLTARRAYSPGLGRFISRDPIEEDGSVNLYDYADNDPINEIDPEGLFGSFPAGAGPTGCTLGMCAPPPGPGHPHGHGHGHGHGKPHKKCGPTDGWGGGGGAPGFGSGGGGWGPDDTNNYNDAKCTDPEGCHPEPPTQQPAINSPPGMSSNTPNSTDIPWWKAR